MSEQHSQHSRWTICLIALVLAGVGAFVIVSLALGTPIHILQGATCPKGSCKSGGLGSFISDANSLDTPATVAIGSVSILGVLAGGAMLGIAHPSATRVLATSAGTLLIVVLAKGIIA